MLNIRRIQAKQLLDGLQEEVIVSAMDDLVIYLQTCPPEQTPLVAILLLHFSILVLILQSFVRILLFLFNDYCDGIELAVRNTIHRHI